MEPWDRSLINIVDRRAIFIVSLILFPCLLLPTMPPRAKKESDEPPRRSSRIKSSASEDVPHPKPKAAPKKRTKDSDGGEETESEDKASVKKKVLFNLLCSADLRR